MNQTVPIGPVEVVSVGSYLGNIGPDEGSEPPLFAPFVISWDVKAATESIAHMMAIART